MKFGEIRHSCERLCKSVYTKQNFCSRATKTAKISVYTTDRIFSVANLSFSLQILTSRKGKDLSYQF